MCALLALFAHGCTWSIENWEGSRTDQDDASADAWLLGTRKTKKLIWTDNHISGSAPMKVIVMESSERKKVGMVLPPPIIFGLAVVGAAIAQYFLIGSFAFSEARALIGGVVVVLSVILIGASARFFKKAGTPVRPVSPATTIVQSGPYRFSRNPMYVGMAGILFGLSVCLGSPLFLVALVVALTITHFGVVLPEEHYLEALHGDAYRRYKMLVRRWM